MKTNIIKISKRIVDPIIPSIVIGTAFIISTLTLLSKFSCLIQLLAVSIGAAITIGVLGHLLHGTKFKGSHMASTVCFVLATVLVPLRYSQWLSFERSVRAAKQIHLLMDTMNCTPSSDEISQQILYHTHQGTGTARYSAPLS